ncbi:ATP-dependent permease [Coniosporium apollinis]|uniref:ATP-dependent permease n=1 Tax=Coniosporium apollinis TaxID=61459 RepID=A0ABQ9NNC0_9PEZI|nr:ATP-dependent permease [Coniosporium apollinis]
MVHSAEEVEAEHSDCGESTEEHEDNGEPPGQPEWKALFYFTTRRHVWVLLAGITFSITAGLVVPVQAFLLGKVFNLFVQFGAGQLSGEQLIKQVSKWCSWLAGLASASWFYHAGEYFAWLTFGELQGKNARDRLLRNLLEKDIEWYDMRKSGVGALFPRLQMQVQELQLATSQPLGYTFQSFATTILSLAMAMYFSWKLTLVILATVPICCVVVAYLSSKMQRYVENQHESLSEALKFATSSLSNIETVKCFNGQDSENWKYTQAIRKAASWYARQANVIALEMGFIRLATLSMFVQGFWYGTSLVDQGKSNPAKILTCFWAALMATQGFMQFLPQLIVLEKGRAAGARLRAIIEQIPKSGEVETGSLQPDHCAGNIEIRNVSFAYPARPKQLVLKESSLYFKANEMTFVIGRSGSGKSTVGQLLMRYYQPTTGDIFLDGTALKSYDVLWLRKNILLVEQTSTLFNETVFQNISFGRSDFERVTLEEVKETAQFALLQEVVNDMPQGYDTIVGSKGSSLSGGQRQRMALARARIRDTPILILDESTSALDYISRSLILEAIRFWRKGKTTICITHDISQILDEDYVYLLEKGEIVQEGFRKAMEAAHGSPFQGFMETLRGEETQRNVEATGEDQEVPHIRHSLLSDSSSAYTGPDLKSLSSEDSLDAFFSEPPTPHMRYMPTFAKGAGAATQRHSQYVPTGLAPLLQKLPQDIVSPKPLLPSPSSPAKRHSHTPSEDSFQAIAHDMPSVDGSDLQQMIARSGSVAVQDRLSGVKIRRNYSVAVEADEISPKPVNLKRMFRKPPAEKAQTEAYTMRRILGTVWPSVSWRIKVLIVIGFLCAAAHAVATPVFSFFFTKLIQTFYVATGRKQKALRYSLAILSIAITDATLSYLMSFLLEYCGQAWINSVRAEAFRRILDQPREYLDHADNSVSRLAECLDRHAEDMRNLLGRFAGLILVAVLMMATSIIWSLATCWKLTMVGLAMAPVLYAITSTYGRVSAKSEGLCITAAEATGMIAQEAVTNIRTVRSLTLENMFLEKYHKATAAALKLGIRRAVFSGIFFGLTDAAILFIQALLFYYGAVLVSSRQFTTTDIMIVFTQLLMSMTNVNSIVAFIPQLSSSRDTATRLLKLSTLPKTSHEHLGTTQVAAIGDIAFNGVTFSYPTRLAATVLSNVSLSIPANTCVAIVGASGSGKSTTAALLLNLYTTPPAPFETLPRITLAGRDIKHLHTPTVRSLISIVSQTPVLFPATVAENITYGLRSSSPFRSPRSIRAAGAAAGIDEFITSLPSGYSTVIGEGGLGLSGGQAQRVAIARALVRKPDVLVLDEATSALDVVSAELVRQSVKRLVERGGMTVVIITHAREMMRVADRVFILEQGRLVEEGGFEELSKGRGRFARLLAAGEWSGEGEGEGVGG